MATGLDAALAIDDVQLKLEGLMKGNTNPVLVDPGLHPAGSKLACVYATDHGDEGTTLTVQAKGAMGDIAAIELAVPAAGFMVLE